MDREEGDLSVGSDVGLARVDGEHVGWHLGRGVIDEDVEFLRENVAGRSGLDAREQAEHSGAHMISTRSIWSTRQERTLARGPPSLQGCSSSRRP